MSDRLYLSCWVRGFGESSMLSDFEKLLELFPFSKLAQRGPLIRLYALERAEPPLLERTFPLGACLDSVLEYAREFTHADCCIEVDTYWDLWQFDGEWKLSPAEVTLLCLGPDFENEIGDHLRVELGVESRFLPIEGVEGSLRMGQSNLRSLLHLVNDIERILPIERRTLWAESGVNFADLLAETIARYTIN